MLGTWLKVGLDLEMREMMWFSLIDDGDGGLRSLLSGWCLDFCPFLKYPALERLLIFLPPSRTMNVVSDQVKVWRQRQVHIVRRMQAAVRSEMTCLRIWDKEVSHSNSRLDSSSQKHHH